MSKIANIDDFDMIITDNKLDDTIKHEKHNKSTLNVLLLY